MGQMEDILDDGSAVLQAAAAGIVKVTGIDRIFFGIRAGYGGFFQQIRQVMHGIQGRAAVFPDDLDGGVAHFLP